MKYLKLFEDYDRTGFKPEDLFKNVPAPGEEATDEQIKLQLSYFLAVITAMTAGWYVASEKEVPDALRIFIKMKQSGKTHFERYVQDSDNPMETEEDMKKYFLDSQSHFGITGKPHLLDQALRTVYKKMDGKTPIFPRFMYELPYTRFMDIRTAKWGEIFNREEIWKVITQLPTYKNTSRK
ncbi:MAG: hypothetical protein CMC98_00675 [Flavobacteriales bacterium]|nr:hypothetical protein [Flavobacteriales bacterium]|tara:strand:+ start:606 stop:1148 length:543 start_codon:yes stop_codon:yes gene_type:complete